MSDYLPHNLARWKPVLPLLVALAGIVATIGLGNWQTHRGDEKAARQAAWDTAVASAPIELDGMATARRVAEHVPQRVRLKGRFVGDASVYVGTRVIDAVAGFYVITPLELAGSGDWILINRGWAASNVRDVTSTPRIAAPDGERVIEGIAVERVPRVLDLGDAPKELGARWQNLDFDAFERASGRSVARLVVQQINDTGDGLRRQWPRPDAGVDRHRGYAFQWYALAALLVILTIVMGARALRKQ